VNGCWYFDWPEVLIWFVLFWALLVIASTAMSMVWWLVGFPKEANDSDGHCGHLRKKQRRR